MKKSKKFFLVVYLCFICFSLLSQQIDFSNKKKSWILAQANQYFENKSYLDALPFYEYIYKKDTNNLAIKYKLGICYLYRSDVPKQSLIILKSLYQLEKSLTKFPNIKYYLARAYHLNWEFDNAISLYQNFLEDFSNKEDTLYSIVNLYIKQCETGKMLVEREKKLKRNDITLIQILDTTINSSNYEYMPIVNADESMLIFTYRGPNSTGGKVNNYGEPDPYGSTYDEDIYFSEKINGKWTKAKPISNLNTANNDAGVTLTPDGQKLLIYRNTPDSSGNLYLSVLEGGNWSNPTPLKGFINSEYWEGSACFDAREQRLIFSSDRPGGYGGRDLYLSKKLPTGEWGMPINLGPNINTPYEEDAPFLFFDGKTLYYSTNGEVSMGGFDIVYSVFQGDSMWSKPTNVGVQINTPFDNKFYTLIANGNKGFFSSMKKGGNGLQDIYTIVPGHYGSNTLFLIKGITYLNDIPGETHIQVNTIPSTDMLSEHMSNMNTGKYLIVFPAGWQYSVSYSAEGYESYETTINVQLLTHFKDSVIDVYLYSQDMFDKYMNISGIAIDSVIGEPIAGAKVILSSDDGSFQAQTITDKNGYYIFRKVPKGKKYNIFIEQGNNAILYGKVADLYNKQGIANVKINDTYTNDKGHYKVKAIPNTGTIADFPVDYLIPYNKHKHALKPDLETYQKILEKYGNSYAKGLVFRVQVGAYKRPKNFEKYKRKKFEVIDKVKSIKLYDKLTRFTIGTYLTMNDAERVRKIAKKEPPHDAFITIFYKGQRMLFSKDFLQLLE